MIKLNNKTFLILEMLITISIIIGLISFSAPRLISYANGIKDSQFESDFKKVKTSVNDFLTHNKIPSNLPSISPNEINSYIEYSKVYDDRGKVNYYIDDNLYNIADLRINPLKLNLNGKFVINDMGDVFYIDENKSLEKNKFCSLRKVNDNTLYRTVDNNDGTISIVKYLGDEKNVIIPAKINGKTVTKIYADINWNEIKQNESHYYNKDGTRNKDAWESINDGFFDKDIEKLTLPCTITEIGENAFGNNSINGLIIPNNTKIIGDYAFFCSDIKYLRMGENIKEIGRESFSSNRIRFLQIPSSVENISDGAFYGNRIMKLTLNEGLINIGSSTNSNGFGVFEDNNIEEINIPNTVLTVGNSSFKDNKLNALKLGDNIDIIGREAFSRNELTSIVINTSPSAIGNYAFKNNKIDGRLSIASIKIKGMEYIDNLNINGDIANELGIKVGPTLHGIKMGNGIFSFR